MQSQSSAVNSFFFSPPPPPRIRSRHCRVTSWIGRRRPRSPQHAPPRSNEKSRTEAFDGEINWPECQRTNPACWSGPTASLLPSSNGPGPGQSTRGATMYGDQERQGRGAGAARRRRRKDVAARRRECLLQHLLLRRAREAREREGGNRCGMHVVGTWVCTPEILLSRPLRA